MSSLINTYQQQNIKALIWQSIVRLDTFQQIKLLEFINAMAGDTKQGDDVLLKYAGCIPKSELKRSSYFYSFSCDWRIVLWCLQLQ